MKQNETPWFQFCVMKKIRHESAMLVFSFVAPAGINAVNPSLSASFE
jgi:hypothetical protein